MKKTMKTLLCALLAVSLVLCFAACKKKAADTPATATGKYIITSIDFGDGNVISGDALLELLTEPGYTPEEIYMELNEDGTGVFVDETGFLQDIGHKDGYFWMLMDEINWEEILIVDEPLFDEEGFPIEESTEATEATEPTVPEEYRTYFTLADNTLTFTYYGTTYTYTKP